MTLDSKALEAAASGFYDNDSAIVTDLTGWARKLYAAEIAVAAYLDEAGTPICATCRRDPDAIEHMADNYNIVGAHEFVDAVLVLGGSE